MPQLGTRVVASAERSRVTVADAEHLVAHPETIKAILRRAQQDAGQKGVASRSHIVLEEAGDGALSLAEAPSHRQKCISVIRTPAVGIKSSGVHSPRPSHQWSEGIAVVNFSKDEGDIQASGPYASVELDLAKEIRIWRGQRRMPVKLAGRVVEELFVRYYSPTETDAEYIAGHNLTSYQLGDTPFFLLLIVRPRGNNAGKKKSPRDERKQLRAVATKLTKASCCSKVLSSTLKAELARVASQISDELEWNLMEWPDLDQKLDQELESLGGQLPGAGELSDTDLSLPW